MLIHPLLYVYLSLLFGRSGIHHPAGYLETMSINEFPPDRQNEMASKPNIVVIGGSYVGKCLAKFRWNF